MLPQKLMKKGYKIIIIIVVLFGLTGCDLMKGESYNTLEQYKEQKDEREKEYKKTQSEAERKREEIIEESKLAEGVERSWHSILRADMFMEYGDDKYTEILVVNIEGKTMVIRVDWLQGEVQKVTRWFL